MFGNLGTGEIIIVLVLLLIFFGAKKIPDLAQGLGKGMKEFKKALKDVEEDINPDEKDSKAKDAKPKDSDSAKS